MAKIKADKILQKLKEKEKKEERGNVTFRVSAELLKSFRSKCDKHGVSSNAVVEELMRGFLE